jgi:hypothetical protein
MLTEVEIPVAILVTLQCWSLTRMPNECRLLMGYVRMQVTVLRQTAPIAKAAGVRLTLPHASLPQLVMPVHGITALSQPSGVAAVPIPGWILQQVSLHGNL